MRKFKAYKGYVTVEKVEDNHCVHIHFKNGKTIQENPSKDEDSAICSAKHLSSKMSVPYVPSFMMGMTDQGLSRNNYVPFT